MGPLFTRARAAAWRAAQPRPARPVRPLSPAANACCLLLTLALSPLLLLAFLLLGERPQH